MYKAVNWNANFELKSNPLNGYEIENPEGDHSDVGILLSLLNKTQPTFQAFEAQVFFFFFCYSPFSF